MTHSVSLFGNFASELNYKILSLVPNGSYATLSYVCKSWQSYVEKNGDVLFWKPIFDKACPQNIRLFTNENTPPSFYTRVKSFFTNKQPYANFIGSSIEDDQQLRDCLYTEDGNLEKFKTKPPFERSLITWQAMLKDATPVLTKLVTDGIIGTYFVVDCCFNLTDSPTVENEKKVLDETIKMNSCILTVSSLTEENIFPYNKAKLICALLPGVLVVEELQMLFIRIIKSHADLSDLKTMSVEFPEAPADSADMVVKTYCLQSHYLGGKGMTEDDLVACKIIDKKPARL